MRETTTARATPVAVGEESSPPAARGASVPIGNLRTFVVLMVVAHHAMLAYHPYAPPPQRSLLLEPRAWLAFPVLDRDRTPSSS
jgi:hypothetical protein